MQVTQTWDDKAKTQDFYQQDCQDVGSESWEVLNKRGS